MHALSNIAYNPVWQTAYANDNDALIPELWAQESLAILEENMVIGNLIHRDFSAQVANFGDIVHTRKPNEFTAKRKVDDDEVTIQDASVTNIPVKLNQHIHVSFMIKDGEESKSMKDLVELYMRPAMLAQARFLDQVILGQVYRFQDYTGGNLGTDITEAAILDTREVLNINKVPQDNGRHLILTPKSETAALKIANFVQADRVGDDGTALREASLGRKYGFNLFMCQNASYVATGNTTVSGAVNSTSGHAAGVTSITVDGFSAAITSGSWITVAGDDSPQRVTGTTGGATPTAIAISPGLRKAVNDNAVVKVYTPGAVNNTGGYAAGYAKTITVDAFSIAPKVGQMVAFGTATDIYSIIEVSGTTGIVLDRPLDAAISDNDAVAIGPAGNYNFALHRNCLALVTRPLALPKAGAGALSALANFNNFGMRAVITYNGQKQGHLVTLDILAGIAKLEGLKGAVMYG